MNIQSIQYIQQNLFWSVLQVYKGGATLGRHHPTYLKEEKNSYLKLFQANVQWGHIRVDMHSLVKTHKANVISRPGVAGADLQTPLKLGK